MSATFRLPEKRSGDETIPTIRTSLASGLYRCPANKFASLKGAALQTRPLPD